MNVFCFCSTHESLSTYRGLEDLSRLYDTIAQVVRGIDNKIFFPCYSFQCANCEFNKDDLCKAWGRKKEKPAA